MTSQLGHIPYIWSDSIMQAVAESFKLGICAPTLCVLNYEQLEVVTCGAYVLPTIHYSGTNL